MRVIHHAASNNVCGLLEPSVVHVEQGVHYTPLNGLESVLKIRNCPVADNVACIFNKVFVKQILNVCHISILRRFLGVYVRI